MYDPVPLRFYRFLKTPVRGDDLTDDLLKKRNGISFKTHGPVLNEVLHSNTEGDLRGQEDPLRGGRPEQEDLHRHAHRLRSPRRSPHLQLSLLVLFFLSYMGTADQWTCEIDSQDPQHNYICLELRKTINCKSVSGPLKVAFLAL